VRALFPSSRAVGVLLSASTLAACSGGDSGSTVAPAPTCDGLTTEPYGMVSVESWPPGTDASLTSFESVEGRFQVVDSCQPGVPVFTKLTWKGGNDFVRESEVELVTSPYADAPCGCVDDPLLGPDTDNDMVGVFEPPAPTSGATFFLENPWFITAQTGPGAQVTAYTPYTFFDPASGLVARSCVTYDIDPYQSAEYTELDLFVRLEPNNVLSATYILYTDDSSQQCELTDWVRQ